MTQPLRVLYVDDDDDIRTIVEMSLSLDADIDARTADGGETALRIASDASWQPDLMVLDVMMPEMDGPTLMGELRKIDRLATTPVVFMTARTRDGDVARYLDMGAVGVVAKPFDPVALASRLRGFAGGD